MSKSEQWVKDYRSVIEWEWFTDVNTAHLWEYIRLRASYQSVTFKGINLQRGQFIEPIRTMAQKTGLSVQNVRTSLKRLISTQEITQEVTQYGSLITVINYDKFQSRKEKVTQDLTQNLTINQHTSNTQVTQLKEYKKKRSKEYFNNPKVKAPLPDYIKEQEEGRLPKGKKAKTTTIKRVKKLQEGMK